VEAAVIRDGASAREVRVHSDLATLAEALAAELREGDLCLTLGAGSIEHVGPELVRRLQRAAGSHVTAGGAGREGMTDA
jgi:UDP-N-acetylmuramate-alanine ligase